MTLCKQKLKDNDVKHNKKHYVCKNIDITIVNSNQDTMIPVIVEHMSLYLQGKRYESNYYPSSYG